MLFEILGVVNEVPVPKELPPVDAAYQLIVPPLAAPSVNVPASQRAAGVVPVMVGVIIIVATTAILGELAHPLATAST